MKSQLIIIIFLSLGFFACDAPGTDILFMDAFLELDAATSVTGEQTFTYQKIVDGETIPSGFIVNLAAVQQGTPITFDFKIEANSTAQEGQQYQVNGNTATIPANASMVELPIEILDDNIEVGDNWTIIISIASSSIPVNPNYESGTHIIEVKE